MYDNSLLDLLKDLLFLGTIGEFLMIYEVTLGTVTMFAMLELLIQWRLGLVQTQYSPY